MLPCQGQKRTPKNICNKDFAKLSGELSGAICLRTLVLLGSALLSVQKNAIAEKPLRSQIAKGKITGFCRRNHRKIAR